MARSAGDPAGWLVLPVLAANGVLTQSLAPTQRDAGYPAAGLLVWPAGAANSVLTQSPTLTASLAGYLAGHLREEMRGILPTVKKFANINGQSGCCAWHLE